MKCFLEVFFEVCLLVGLYFFVIRIYWPHSAGDFKKSTGRPLENTPKTTTGHTLETHQKSTGLTPENIPKTTRHTPAL